MLARTRICIYLSKIPCAGLFTWHLKFSKTWDVHLWRLWQLAPQSSLCRHLEVNEDKLRYKFSFHSLTACVFPLCRNLSHLNLAFLTYTVWLVGLGMEAGGTLARSYICEFPMPRHGCYRAAVSCIKHLLLDWACKHSKPGWGLISQRMERRRAGILFLLNIILLMPGNSFLIKTPGHVNISIAFNL